MSKEFETLLKSAKPFDAPSFLRNQRKQEPDRDLRREVAIQHQKVLQEFKIWKRKFIQMIEQSEISYRVDGSYEFVLPPSIVNVCIEVMLKEYMRARKASREEGMEKLRAQLEEMADKIQYGEPKAASEDFMAPFAAEIVDDSTP